MKDLRRLVLLVLLSGCAGRFAAAPGQEREGLGTAWGEARSSRVRSVSFERADFHRPLAVVSRHYDDRRGLLALTGLEAYPVSGCEEEGVAGGELRVTVVDGRGWPLPQLCHGGRRYLEGEEGERYLIEIENRGLDQFEVVASVDGLDVMDGERASPLKRGYVVAPRSTLRIDGFRRSGSEVAAFRFGSVAGSYAALKGDDANVGVIAVAVFPERGWAGGWRADRARSDEARRRRLADPFPAAPRFALPPRGY